MTRKTKFKLYGFYDDQNLTKNMEKAEDLPKISIIFRHRKSSVELSG